MKRIKDTQAHPNIHTYKHTHTKHTYTQTHTHANKHNKYTHKQSHTHTYPLIIGQLIINKSISN